MTRRKELLFALSAAAALLSGCAELQPAAPGGTRTVKITPLGSHDGEFCPLDRALVFEDPDGTRILYDAGRTVRGPNDPRLGKIDAILVSQVVTQRNCHKETSASAHHANLRSALGEVNHAYEEGWDLVAPADVQAAQLLAFGEVPAAPRRLA